MPAEMPADHPLVTTALGCAGALGRRGRPAGLDSWHDAATFTRAGTPTFSFGPDGIRHGARRRRARQRRRARRLQRRDRAHDDALVRGGVRERSAPLGRNPAKRCGCDAAGCGRRPKAASLRGSRPLRLPAPVRRRDRPEYRQRWSRRLGWLRSSATLSAQALVEVPAAIRAGRVAVGSTRSRERRRCQYVAGVPGAV